MQNEFIELVIGFGITGLIFAGLIAVTICLNTAGSCVNRVCKRKMV